MTSRRGGAPAVVGVHQPSWGCTSPVGDIPRRGLRYPLLAVNGSGIDGPGRLASAQRVGRFDDLSTSSGTTSTAASISLTRCDESGLSSRSSMAFQPAGSYRASEQERPPHHQVVHRRPADPGDATSARRPIAVGTKRSSAFRRPARSCVSDGQIQEGVRTVRPVMASS
jgi:hypothetical protein